MRFRGVSHASRTKPCESSGASPRDAPGRKPSWKFEQLPLAASPPAAKLSSPALDSLAGQGSLPWVAAKPSNVSRASARTRRVSAARRASSCAAMGNARPAASSVRITMTTITSIRVKARALSGNGEDGIIEVAAGGVLGDTRAGPGRFACEGRRERAAARAPQERVGALEPLPRIADRGIVTLLHEAVTHERGTGDDHGRVAPPRDEAPIESHDVERAGKARVEDVLAPRLPPGMRGTRCHAARFLPRFVGDTTELGVLDAGPRRGAARRLRAERHGRRIVSRGCGTAADAGGDLERHAPRRSCRRERSRRWSRAR